MDLRPRFPHFQQNASGCHGSTKGFPGLKGLQVLILWLLAFGFSVWLLALGSWLFDAFWLLACGVWRVGFELVAVAFWL